MAELTCFKAYDVRGEIGANIDEAIACRVGRAIGQHFGAKSVVIGFDARETSSAFAAAASRGVRDAGSDVISIEMAGSTGLPTALKNDAAGPGCCGLTA